MVKAYGIALVLALTSCGYSPGFDDCAISCASDRACPDGFSCGGESLCVREATTSCATGDAAGNDTSTGDMDAASTDAVASQDAQQSVILNENSTDDVTAAGFACTTCPGGVVTQGAVQTLSWFREFSLPDFSGPPWNVTGGFQMTAVHVGCSTATDATLTIKVYTYSGSLFASTISMGSAMQIGSSASMHVQSCVGDVVVPVTVPAIAGGKAFVVEVDESDVYSDNMGSCGSFTKQFRLGANASSESHGSYYKASCAGGTGASAPTVWTSTDVIITVEGSAN